MISRTIKMPAAGVTRIIHEGMKPRVPPKKLGGMVPAVRVRTAPFENECIQHFPRTEETMNDFPLKTHPDLLEVTDVARRLGVSVSTVYDMAKQRKIQHRRIGVGRGRVLFTEEDVQEYLEASKVERGALPHSANFTHRRHSSP